jgi:uncharacterized protein (TIGR02391 family)
MYQLLNVIPDVDAFLALEPEELAAKILFLIRRTSNPDKLHIGNLTSEATNTSWTPDGSVSPYRGREKEVGLALSEAFAWLVAQGLIVPDVGMEGTQGWSRLSRRARRFESEEDFAHYARGRHLLKEMLHPRIAQKVWAAFMRGEYDGAVFQAMKAVEVAVRDASGLSDRDVGVKLMRSAFAPAPNAGPLTDTVAEPAEQVGRMELFAGAIGSFKNPQSHRDVNLDDPVEATEAIMLANHLLRIVDGRRRD